MLGPNLTFSIILATLCGALFHLVVGGDARRLSIFLVAGWIGFALGQIAGSTFGIAIFVIGDLHIFMSILGAFVALMIAWLLSSTRNRRRT